MKQRSRVIAVVVLSMWLAGSSASQANISTGPSAIEDRFANSDFVCICAVTRIVQTNSPSLTDTRLSPANYLVTAHIAQMLKGTKQAVDVNVLFTGVDPLRGAPLSVNSSYLMFLHRVRTGDFQLADRHGAVLIPPDFPIATDSEGLDSLEAELMQGLASHTSDAEGIELIGVLLQFGRLSASTIQNLESFARGPPSKLALLSLEALSKASGHPATYVPQLISMLLEYEKRAPSVLATVLAEVGDPLSEIADIIADDTAATDLAGLKQLTDSHIRPLRLCSMLAIRRLHSPDTIPFLVTALDSDDDMVQYEAVISLAEITRQYGDFAPGKGLYDQNPAKYKGMWKDWYQRQGKAYATEK